MKLSEKLEVSAGRPSGFDYMRLILALGIVSWHTIVTTYGHGYEEKIWATPQVRVVVGWLLPAFFALSGFLVAGSLERCKTLAGFLYLRVIRIFPALVVEILLSAFVLGPTMTAFSLGQYFNDPILYHYLLNCLGIIHYVLPGLFLHNPCPVTVNGQLWTVPFELKCYLSVGILGVIGIIHRPRLFLWIVIGLSVLLLVGVFLEIHARHPVPGFLSNHSLHGDNLVMYFLFGVLFFKFRAVIPYSRSLACVAVLISLGLLAMRGGDFIAEIPATYVVVFLGVTNPRKIGFLETGDYSYGIFLYGFPIQQAVVATRLLPLNGWVDLLASLPLIMLLAIASWHFWEKHFLNLRRFRPWIDRVFAFTQHGGLTRRFAKTPLPTDSL